MKREGLFFIFIDFFCSIAPPSKNAANKEENNNENEKQEYANKAEILSFPNISNNIHLIILFEYFPNIF